MQKGVVNVSGAPGDGTRSLLQLPERVRNALAELTGVCPAAPAGEPVAHGEA